MSDGLRHLRICRYDAHVDMFLDGLRSFPLAASNAYGPELRDSCSSETRDLRNIAS